MDILAVVNLEGLDDSDVAHFSLRRAARAVVRDAEGRVALLHASAHGFYKLPGGGIEGDESPVDTLRRECREEIGCEIEVGKPIGEVVEYRATFRFKQISYCYHAAIIGEKRQPAFTASEIGQGFRVVWAPPEEALRLVAESVPNDYQGPFVVARDKAFLCAALHLSPLEPKGAEEEPGSNHVSLSWE